jgi:hypothetical protein
MDGLSFNMIMSSFLAPVDKLDAFFSITHKLMHAY